MNAISLLTQLPTTQKEIEVYVDMVKNDILSGYIQPEASAIVLKAYEEIIKTLRSDYEIKEYIQNACDLHPEKSFSYQDAKFTKTERSLFDFKACEDHEWLQLQMKLNKIKGEIKVREEWLKTLKEPTPDPETGEIINNPVCEKTSIVSISLKK